LALRIDDYNDSVLIVYKYNRRMVMRRVIALAGLAISIALPVAAQEACDSLFATRMVAAKPDLYARTGGFGSLSAWIPLDELDSVEQNGRLEVVLAATARAERDIYVLKIGEQRLNGDKPASYVRLIRDYYWNPCGLGRNSLFAWLFGASFGEQVSIAEYAAYHAVLSRVSQELYRFHINYQDVNEECRATDDEENVAEFLFGNAAERDGQRGDRMELVLSRLRAFTDSAYASALENDPSFRRFFKAYEGYRALEVRIIPHLTESRVCHAFTLGPQRLDREIAISLNELLARTGRGHRLPDRDWLVAVD
jgi:hypothetical protein